VEEINSDISYIKIFSFLSITTILFFIKPIYSIVLLALVIVLMILKNYRIGLFVLGGLPFTQLASLKFFESHHIFLLCFIVTFVSFTLHFSRHLSFQINTSYAYKWFLFFIALALFSGVYAENLKYWQGELYAYIRAFILFFLIIQGIDDEKSLYIIAKFIVLSLFASSVISFILFLKDSSNTLSLVLLRFIGNLSDPNDFAMTLCGALPLAVFFMKTESKLISKLFFGTCGLVFIFFIVITQSRGGILAAALISIFMFPLFKRKLLIMAFLTAVLIVILTLFPVQLIFYRIIHLYDILTGKSLFDPSFTQRIALYSAAFNVIFSHPVFGVGANNFIVHSVRFLSPSLYTHNMFTEVAADMGILGLLPFVIIVFSPFFWFPKIIRQLGIVHRRFVDFVSFLRVSLIGMIAASFFLSCQTKSYLWIMLAMVYAIIEIYKKNVASAFDSVASIT